MTHRRASLGTGKTRLEVLEKLGLRRGLLEGIEIAPKQQHEENVNAVRMILPRCWFDAVKCRKGVEALKLYRTEWDEEKRVFRRKALHDWTSHAADAFAYLAMMLEGSRDRIFNRKLDYPKRKTRQRPFVGPDIAIYNHAGTGWPYHPPD
jgi:hypothetical protein